MPVLLIPEELQRYTAGESRLELPGANVAELLASAFEQFPDLKIRMINQHGNLYPYLPAFLNAVKLPARGFGGTAVTDDDTLEFVVMASGG